MDTATGTVATTLGQRLRTAREDADLSMYRASVLLGQVLGRSITPETIRAYENDETRRPNLTVVLGLVAVYGGRISQVAPEMADEAERLASLLFLIRARESATDDSLGIEPREISVMSSRRLWPVAS